MKAAIVTIGDEILIGQIIDTNSAWMAKELTAAGIDIKEMASISDDPAQITSTLDRLIGTVDLILMTGGLGPTRDDLTKDTLNEYFGGTMIMNQEVLDGIEEFFRKRGRSMLETNRRQALVPDVCKILPNNFGTAPGMWFTKDNTSIISMPGVPYEMKPLVSEQLLPALQKELGIPVIVHKTVMTQGVPESYLAEMIKDWELSLPACMKLAYLPRPGVVRLRLTVKGDCAGSANEMLDEKIAGLTALIGDHIFGFEDTLLEKVLGELLKEKGLHIATAESCTGGNIAHLITSVAGSSSYFNGSIVAYSNEVKMSVLGVDESLIAEHGAVSSRVAEAMAKGVQQITGSDIAISTTGIAGPDGGTEEKPVGTVWIGIAVGDEVFSKLYKFGGHRELVIEQSSIMALGLLFRRLKSS